MHNYVTNLCIVLYCNWGVGYPLGLSVFCLPSINNNNNNNTTYIYGKTTVVHTYNECNVSYNMCMYASVERTTSAMYCFVYVCMVRQQWYVL